MKTLIPIIFIIAGILYVITPYNLLPSFIPVIGWIDDIAVAALMIYYMKYGKLPDFINRFLGNLAGTNRGRSGSGYHDTYGGWQQYRQHQKAGSAGSGSYDGSHAKTPHEVLGVSPKASSREIHTAYRKLAQQYHPDKVAHLGREIQETAKKKFVEIQAAYEALSGKKP